MRKVIILIIVAFVVGACKPQQHFATTKNTKDSCQILIELIKKNWAYEPKLDYFIDSLYIPNLYKIATFKKCFNQMTTTDVKNLFGNPTEISIGQIPEFSENYSYCTYPSFGNRNCCKFSLSFIFKDKHLTDIEEMGCKSEK